MSKRKPPQKDAATHTQATKRAPRKTRRAPAPQITVTTVGRIGWQTLTMVRLLVLGYPEARARELVRRVAATRAPEAEPEPGPPETVTYIAIPSPRSNDREPAFTLALAPSTSAKAQACEPEPARQKGDEQ